ncbi:MAG: DUF4038 domain-containing protein [Gammaproteobacteria bacterium]
MKKQQPLLSQILRKKLCFSCPLLGKNASRKIGVLVLTFLAAGLAAVPDLKAATNVPVYGVFELTLTASGSYSNPYLKMPGDNSSPGFVTATFSGPGNRKINLDGFWDGGKTWKVRMAPTVAGTWSYWTSSADSGLNGKTGSFNAVSSSAHGFIQVDPNHPHHFRWTDGKPWYYAATSISIASFDTSAPTSERFRLDDGTFQNMASVRASQGFTTVHWGFYGYQKPLFNNKTQANEGGPPFTNYDVDKLNPAYFQYGDQRVKTLLDVNIVPQFIIGWPDQGIWSYGDARLKRYWRYIIARYTAYNIMYNLFGEGDEFGTNWHTIVNDFGSMTKTFDPYGHLTSTHLTRGPDATLAGYPWYGFIMLQLATSATNSYLNYNKPVINTEYCGYEYVINSWGSCFGTPLIDGNILRPMIWDIRGRGGYFVYETWWGSNLTSTGALAAAYANQFFENRTKYWLLESHPELFGGKQGLADPLHEYVVYLKTGGSVSVNLTGASGTFDVEWYNPRTGAVTKKGSVTGGAPRSFTAPDTNDWTLHLAQTEVVPVI